MKKWQEKQVLSENELSQVTGGGSSLPEGVSPGRWWHYHCSCGSDWWSTDHGVDETDDCKKCHKYVVSCIYQDVY